MLISMEQGLVTMGAGIRLITMGARLDNHGAGIGKNEP